MTAKEFLQELDKKLGYIAQDPFGLDEWYEMASEKFNVIQPTSYMHGYIDGQISFVVSEGLFTVEELLKATGELQDSYSKEEIHSFYNVIEFTLMSDEEMLSWVGYKDDLEGEE